MRNEAVPPGCIFYAIVYPEQFLPSVLSPESTARIQYKGASDRVKVLGFVDDGNLTLKVTYPPDSGELIYATMETALELLRTVAELSNLDEL